MDREANKQTQLLGMSWRAFRRDVGANNGRRVHRERERDRDREREREETWILCGSVDLAGVKAVRRALIPARLKLWANQA